MTKVIFIFMFLFLLIKSYGQNNCPAKLNLISKKVFVTDAEGEKQQAPIKVKLQFRNDSISISVEDYKGDFTFDFTNIKSTICKLDSSKQNGLFIFEGFYLDKKEDTTYTFDAKFIFNVKNGVYSVNTINKSFSDQNFTMEMIENKKTVKKKRN